MSDKTIAVAGDHAGFPLKVHLIEVLREDGWTVIDLGAHSVDSVDYPDYGYALAHAVGEGEAQFGLAVCGSGIGISIAANRHPGVRAAVCSDPVSARLSRQHNDANVLAMGSRLIGDTMAVETLKAFLGAHFEGGRHERRVQKLGRPKFEPVG